MFENARKFAPGRIARSVGATGANGAADSVRHPARRPIPHRRRGPWLPGFAPAKIADQCGCRLCRAARAADNWQEPTRHRCAATTVPAPPHRRHLSLRTGAPPPDLPSSGRRAPTGAGRHLRAFGQARRGRRAERHVAHRSIPAIDTARVPPAHRCRAWLEAPTPARSSAGWRAAMRGKPHRSVACRREGSRHRRAVRHSRAPNQKIAALHATTAAASPITGATANRVKVAPRVAPARIVNTTL